MKYKFKTLIKIYLNSGIQSLKNIEILETMLQTDLVKGMISVSIS